MLLERGGLLQIKTNAFGNGNANTKVKSSPGTDGEGIFRVSLGPLGSEYAQTNSCCQYRATCTRVS
jgi:hypothetical protein